MADQAPIKPTEGPSNEIARLIESSIQSNNEKLFQSITETFNKSVEQIKRAQAEANEVQTREIKKIKLTDPKIFKRKGNELQYKFSSKLEDVLTDAKDSISAKNPSKALESLDEGISFIKDRQKLILLADKSEYGWKTAAEYEQHELATDEADAKRIRRAEERAEKVTKSEIAKKKSKKQSVFSRFKFQGVAQPGPSGLQNAVAAASFQQSSKRSGSCFACGRFGHWRANCPLVASVNHPPSQGKK